jgi:hypothetical protein
VLKEPLELHHKVRQVLKGLLEDKVRQEPKDLKVHKVEEE